MSPGRSPARNRSAVAELTGFVRQALGAAAGGVAVAYSGGVDSTVLLDVLYRLRIRPLRAIHVHHGLQPAADEWVGHCRRFCARRRIEFVLLRVTVPSRSSSGLEAAARESRYRVLAGVLRAGETLLTAHHGDDQAETLLLNLFRGSGVSGLAGARADGAFGAGRLCRPLLGLTRASIESYARARRLRWIEDPMNADEALSRSFVRRSVLPLIESRWPGVQATIARNSRLAAESAVLLDQLGAADAARAWRRQRLSLAAFLRLDGARQRNLLRFLCRRELGSAPGAARLEEGLNQLLTARRDRQPLLAWPGGEIRRYRDCLYLLRPLPDAGARSGWLLDAARGASIDLGPVGSLRLALSRRGGLRVAALPASLTVRYRGGGEGLRPVGRGRRRELRKLLQEAGVLPWMRDRIPLLYAGDSLAAVGDLWIAAEFAADKGKPGLRVIWSGHPPLG
ncbi:MAG: tRNA lysidine(34) synthetase TilS [Gammaproteobacteria bacterium]|nr:tRNA lysidine(34) synthetase TilS [Gammaproteobacteria bacterium]